MVEDGEHQGDDGASRFRDVTTSGTRWEPPRPPVPWGWSGKPSVRVSGPSGGGTPLRAHGGGGRRDRWWTTTPTTPRRSGPPSKRREAASLDGGSWRSSSPTSSPGPVTSPGTSVTALAGADEVWVTEIYPAREAPIPGVTGMLVAQAALDAGASDVSFHPDLAELPGEIARASGPVTSVLTMGAGSIESLAGDLLAALRGGRRGGGPSPMKRWLTFVFVLALAVALGGVVSRVPEALAEVEAFRVTEIRLRGARFLTQEEAVGDSGSFAERQRLGRHQRPGDPTVRASPGQGRVTVHRRFPNALLVKVVESEPVALFPNPTLEPVDDAGRILPIDPAVPQAGSSHHDVGGQGRPRIPHPGGPGVYWRRRSPAWPRGIPSFFARISDFALDCEGGREGPDLGSPGHAPLPCRVFRAGASRPASGSWPTPRPGSVSGIVADLDLRFDDQVVVRFSRDRGSLNMRCESHCRPGHRDHQDLRRHRRAHRGPAAAAGPQGPGCGAGPDLGNAPGGRDPHRGNHRLGEEGRQGGRAHGRGHRGSGLCRDLRGTHPGLLLLRCGGGGR